MEILLLCHAKVTIIWDFFFSYQKSETVAVCYMILITHGISLASS